MKSTAVILDVLRPGELNTQTSEYALHPGTICLKVWDGTFRLINFDGGSFALSRIGSELLEKSLKGSPQEAILLTSGKYRVAPERVQRDLHQLLGTLKSFKLLIQRGGESSNIRNRSSDILQFSLRRLLSAVLSHPTASQLQVATLLGLAWLFLRVFGWKETVRSWEKDSSSRASPADGFRLEVSILERRVVQGLAASLFPVDCKARALVCWALLRSAGHDAQLIVGVDLFPFLGHCWCESGGRIIADREIRCHRFSSVMCYPEASLNTISQ